MTMKQNPGIKDEEQFDENTNKIPVVLSSDDDDDEKEEQIPENNDKQIVLYNPPSSINDDDNGDVVGKEIVPISVCEPVSDPDPLQCRPLSAPRVLPSVGAFTVQCAACFKWRIIPSKEKYEEIREHIMDQPFSCDLAKEWRPDISCDDPADIEQDGSRLWAIDKPSISQPPPGWERELRIRGEGSSKFADVYYISPTGKRMRSMVEIHKYLMEHPEFIRQGTTLSQFSFQIPKPLQENYVRKRPARINASAGEAVQANPLSWAVPDDTPAALQLGGPGLSDSYSRGSLNDLQMLPPVKKKSKSSSKHSFSGGLIDNQPHSFNSDSMHNQPHRFSSNSMHDQAHRFSSDSLHNQADRFRSDSMHNQSHRFSSDSMHNQPERFSSDSIHNQPHRFSSDSMHNQMHKFSSDSMHKQRPRFKIKGPSPPPDGFYDM